MGHGIVLVLPNVIVFLALVAEIVPMPARMIAPKADAAADAAPAAAAAAAYVVRVRMVIVGIGVVNWCGMQIGGVVSTARWGARADRGAAVQYANRRFTCIGICMIYTHVRYGQGRAGRDEGNPCKPVPGRVLYINLMS